MNGDEPEDFGAYVETFLREQEENAALPESDNPDDEDSAAWLKTYLRENSDMLILALEDDGMRASAEAILGESVESALGLKSNTARMRASVDPGGAESREEMRHVGLTRQLIYDCEIITGASPLLHGPGLVRYWIHYRESIC